MCPLENDNSTLLVVLGGETAESGENKHSTSIEVMTDDDDDDDYDDDGDDDYDDDSDDDHDDGGGEEVIEIMSKTLEIMRQNSGEKYFSPFTLTKSELLVSHKKAGKFLKSLSDTPISLFGHHPMGKKGYQ